MSEVSPVAAARHTQREPAAPARQRSAFHALLSELNPLQYIPVLGTIYRAATGDTIPERARLIGSLVVSGLTGGPVGVATNIAITALEKLTGIDPEKIGRTFLASLGSRPSVPQVTAPPVALAVGTAWSPTQLAAYGVTQTPDGSLQRNDLSGSDVLNDLELRTLSLTA